MKLFKKIYKGKKILITGHTGFKGSWCQALLNFLGADTLGYSDRIPSGFYGSDFHFSRREAPGVADFPIYGL